MSYLSQEEVHRLRYIFCTNLLKKEDKRPFEFYQGKKILLWTRKPGLGDMVMNAICCDILRNEYGLNVWFGCRENPGDREFPYLLEGIVPCYTYKPDLHTYPLDHNKKPIGYENGIDHQGKELPFDIIIDFRYNIGMPQNTIFQCLTHFGINKIEPDIAGFRVNQNKLHVPVEKYDVVICGSTGGWKPVRSYRKTEELAEALEKRGLRTLDLTSVGKEIKKEYGAVGLLSIVNHAKYYIGTETGPTHLVSGVHSNAIVLQAGIHYSAFWNIYGRTKVLEQKLECGGRKCRVRVHEECKERKGVCIDRINIDDILRLL
jgi:hypothetical protein